MKEKKQIKNIILHIGLPKTATTSIQCTLFKNKSSPEFADKYYYPKSWGTNHGHDITKMFDGHYRDPNTLMLAKECISIASNKGKIRLKTELYGRDFETLVISSEEFFMLPEQDFNDLILSLCETCNIDAASINIVTFVRDPISLFTSVFQQVTKGPPYFSKSDIGTLSELLPESGARIEKLLDVFGKDNLAVYRFEDAVKHQYGPVGFFYEKILKFDLTDISKINIVKQNESISQIAMDICLFINERYPMYDHEQRILSGNRNCYDLFILTNAISGVKFKLPKNVRSAHLERANLLSDKFGFKYSIDELQLAIDNDTDPDHKPTRENLKEISNIFYKLDSIIQKGVIEYLHEISTVYSEYDLVKNTIDDLVVKKNSFTNSIFHLWAKKRKIIIIIFLYKRRLLLLGLKIRKIFLAGLTVSG